VERKKGNQEPDEEEKQEFCGVRETAIIFVINTTVKRGGGPVPKRESPLGERNQAAGGPSRWVGQKRRKKRGLMSRNSGKKSITVGGGVSNSDHTIPGHITSRYRGGRVKNIKGGIRSPQGGEVKTSPSYVGWVSKGNFQGGCHLREEISRKGVKNLRKTQGGVNKSHAEPRKRTNSNNRGEAEEPRGG